MELQNITSISIPCIDSLGSDDIEECDAVAQKELDHSVATSMLVGLSKTQYSITRQALLDQWSFINHEKLPTYYKLTKHKFPTI